MDIQSIYDRGYVNGKTEEIREVISKMDSFYNDMLDRDGADTIEGRADAFNELREWLMGRNLTCFDCKYHFTSDCYLECYKHDRINDNKICDDFEPLIKRA